MRWTIAPKSPSPNEKSRRECIGPELPAPNGVGTFGEVFKALAVLFVAWLIPGSPCRVGMEAHS